MTPAEPIDDATRGGTRALHLVLILVGVVAIYLGYRLFWFLCDDAYIAFRYTAQSMAGNGYVWNPPPFQPVEGYTSFLWVFLLRWVWAATGLLPTETANTIALCFGYGTLALVVRMFWRARLPERAESLRLPMLVLAGLGVVANRTFLTWLSSGLETSLFNFCLTWWFVVAITRRDSRGRFWLAWLSSAAACAMLTRPGGVLFVMGTVVLAGDALMSRRARVRGAGDGGAERHGELTGLYAHKPAALVAQLLPLSLVVVHLLWRHATYGEWVPNTYYAKLVEAWPQAGVRYLASFILEYALYVPLLVLLGAFVVALRRRDRGLVEATAAHFHRLVAIGAVLAHAGYYTLVVGGDHFEYRVYSWAIPLIFVGAAWLAVWLPWRPRWAVGSLALFVVLSLPIPWVHWNRTHENNVRVWALRQPVADAIPLPMRPVARQWEQLQDWLITRMVGVRHQEHEVWAAEMLRHFPPLERGREIVWEDGFPIASEGCVGVGGWNMPGVAILDEFGLNDRIIAHNPIARRGHREMAHDRGPPPGYIECFRPNVRAHRRTAIITPRAQPLTADEIRACEARFMPEGREVQPPVR